MTPEMREKLKERLPDGQVFFSPGRVNLLGEHVDYNGGSVLPMALSKGTGVVAQRRDDGRLCFSSGAQEERGDFALAGPRTVDRASWLVYPLAVLAALEERGCRIGGLTLHFEGDLPSGAGLSSSASLEVATALACRTLFNLPFSDLELAQIAHRAENHFVGVNCGIMDQYAVALAHRGHALALDCQEGTYEHWRLPGDCEVLITDSGVRRKLTESRYNERRAECEAALAALGRRGVQALNLCAVSPDELELLSDEPVLWKRAAHCVGEARRMILAKQAVEQGDAWAFGELMTQCHWSLARNFEVSHPALDCLVQTAVGQESCMGSRLTGAGFGGCVVSLVRRGTAEEVHEALDAAARAAGWPRPRSFSSEPEAGACELGVLTDD